MQRPVEINRKKTRLMLLAVFGLGLAALGIWTRYDEFVPFSWDSAFDALGIALVGIPGLTAFVSLVVSLFSHEPYLLVYDDRIEMPRLWSRNCWVLHFADVKDMRKEDDTKALFTLQPFLKKSYLPRRTSWFKKFLGADFGISLSALDMPSKDAYDLMYDRYQRYHHLDRSQGKETEDEVLDQYLSRLTKSSSIGKWIKLKLET